jgi:hypothetical protein
MDPREGREVVFLRQRTGFVRWAVLRPPPTLVSASLLARSTPLPLMQAGHAGGGAAGAGLCLWPNAALLVLAPLHRLAEARRTAGGHGQVRLCLWEWALHWAPCKGPAWSVPSRKTSRLDAVFLRRCSFVRRIGYVPLIAWGVLCTTMPHKVRRRCCWRWPAARCPCAHKRWAGEPAKSHQARPPIHNPHPTPPCPCPGAHAHRGGQAD